MSRHLFVIAIVALLLGCGPYDPKKVNDLADCYRAEFGTLPPAGVTVIKARQMVIRDWGAQWLQIHADTNLIDAVILTNFTKQKSAPAGFGSSKSGYTPDWWVLPPSEQLEFYTCAQWTTNGGWHSSSASIAVHRVTSVVFFRCDRTN
jgi:hypothetical protein